MSAVKTRMATMDDYERICDLYRQLDQYHIDMLPDIFQLFEGPPRPREFLNQFIEGEDGSCIVAESEGEIIGFLAIKKEPPSPLPGLKPRNLAHIYDFVVEDEWRHRGVGSMLLNTAKQWAEDHHCRFMRTYLWLANGNAKAFYTKHGFRPVVERLELDLDAERLE